ncbi:hypothetical protein PCLA_06r0537 [Pseudomonas citronellolis]|nr:hypothetical protein PCLA_06r0537 [Pseudomonas citronellolis]
MWGKVLPKGSSAAGGGSLVWQSMGFQGLWMDGHPKGKDARPLSGQSFPNLAYQ